MPGHLPSWSLCENKEEGQDFELVQKGLSPLQPCVSKYSTECMKGRKARNSKYWRSSKQWCPSVLRLPVSTTSTIACCFLSLRLASDSGLVLYAIGLRWPFSFPFLGGVVLGFELRTSCLLGRGCTPKPHPQPLSSDFWASLACLTSSSSTDQNTDIFF